MEIPDWYEATVTRQLAMAPQTWSVLTEHGIDSDTPLRLDFAFHAPDEASAEALVAFLRLETDYDVDTDFDKTGPPELRTWTVVGVTHPATFTRPVLEDWVRWMVAAGVEYGACRFDGWGASVASPED